MISFRRKVATGLGVWILWTAACSSGDEVPLDPVDPGKVIQAADRVEIPVTNAPFLTEVSGMAHSLQSDSILWVHNDSGDKPAIYALSKSGNYLGEISLVNATNQDWESISAVEHNGKKYIYIADFGDNKSQYTSYYFYRFQEPSPSEYLGKGMEVTAEIAEYTYDDIITQDAEAFLIDHETLDILILSKVLSNARVYDLGDPFNGENLAIRLGTIDYGFVTAADLNKEQVIIKTYSAAYCFRRLPDLYQSIQAEPTLLTYTPEYRGESICWDLDMSGYYTMSELNEGEITPVLNYYRFR